MAGGDADGGKVDRQARILEAAIDLLAREGISGVSINRWWDDLGDPRLDEATASRLVGGLVSETVEDMDALVARRDAGLTAMVAATHGVGG